ncbi:hypothetical protein [Lysobacter gummosus]|uniref:hypothetical protein n=1 Tax=Lysobacter gummosus TaxID=262324 RepID=UPI00363AB93E
MIDAGSDHQHGQQGEDQTVAGVRLHGFGLLTPDRRVDPHILRNLRPKCRFACGGGRGLGRRGG